MAADLHDEADLRITGRVAHTVARFIPVQGLGRRARAVAIAVTTRLIAANAIAGLFVAIYLSITEEPTAERSRLATIGLNAVFYGAAVLLFCAAAIIRGRRVFAPQWQWLDTGVPAAEDQRLALLGQPLRIGLFPLRYWTFAAALSVVVRLVYGASAAQIVLGAATVLLGGAVAALLGVLLSERVLRPAFALAARGQATPTPAFGVGNRLVAAWALGSGIPLAGIVATPFLAPDAEPDHRWAMGWLAFVGLVSGFGIMVMAANSITGPIRRVRVALQSVGSGDLDTVVVVDDPGELGQLQAGVNEMVAALRERKRIEDLFSRHVGTSVAQHALEQGAQLGGEVRCVTVVFVDLKGSTELARRLPPSDVVDLLNRFFAAVVTASDAEGGWLDSFEGDGALCVFGAPDDLADHATRGLRAARTLAGTLAGLRRDTPDLDAGIGVASGDVVAGHVGTETRLEYTVIGPPVNTAARLTVAAKGRLHRALADAHVIEAADADEAARWTPGPPVDLEGLEPCLPVWEPAAVP